MSAAGKLSFILRIILGPWPIRPIGSGVIIALIVMLGTASFNVLNEGTGGAQLQLVATLTGIISGSFFALMLFTFEKVRKKIQGDSITRTGYLGVTVSTVAVIVIPASLAWVNLGPRDNPTSFAEISFIAIRPLFILLAVQSILGLYHLRYQKQVENLENALHVVQQQKALIVEADERARFSVATFLHDEVQSALLVLGMRVGQVSELTQGEIREELEEIVADIENMRHVKVRSASRRLSPVLAMSGLVQSLRELASSWKPAMDVTTQFDDASKQLLDTGSPTNTGLAIYRITEQALINSAGHAQATRVAIDLAMHGNILRLKVTDNGSPDTSTPSIPGSGSAIMDSWAAIVGGSWSRESLLTGTVLTALVPSDPQIAAITTSIHH